MKAAFAAIVAVAAPALAKPFTSSTISLASSGTITSATSSATSTGESWPSCWADCFSQYGVTSEGGLCKAPLSNQVESCIEDNCSKADAAQYESWGESYCGAVTVTDTMTESTTICPVTETQTSGSSTSTVVYTTTSTVTHPVTTPNWPTWSSTATSTVTVVPVTPSAYTTVTVTWGGVWTSTQTWAPETVAPKPTGWGKPNGPWTTITRTKSFYTTICPVTETWVSSGTTSVISYITTATHSTDIVTTQTGYPTGTGTATSTCASKPKPTEKCVPCQGQPDSNPDNFCGLTVNTNYWLEVPKTCNTVKYDFKITQGTISPDGVPRLAMLVNGQMPGPAITANWGDTIQVTVHNQLPASLGNGTTIHWHGLRQNYTNAQDGVPSIVQCPIAPGQSQVYTFVADSYGTSWYHSHFALQTWEGLFGPIIINGPASATYDEEQSVVLQDWSHATADELYDSAQNVATSNRTNPVMDLGLINGMNVFSPPGDPAPTGKRWEMNVVAGKSYRLRLVNAAIGAVFVFYVDQHELTVIAADFVPVTPFTVQTLPINIGQRYDVILTANQPVGNYYMRADNQQPCSPMITWNNTNAIVRYQGAPDAEPTSQPYGYAPTCSDLEYGLLKPVVSMTAGSQQQTIDEDVVIGVDPAQPSLYKWTLSGTTFQSQWGDPTLLSILDDGVIPSYSGNLAISAPELGQWVYVIIDSPIPVAHPIHLHGHEFLILAQGQGLYNSSIPLNTVNPPRRDVAQMNAAPIEGQGSYLVVAFYTDNPGVWLMHCHIGWHSAMGFALQIIEAQDQIASTVDDTCALQEQCAAWNAYSNSLGLVVPDSGI